MKRLVVLGVCGLLVCFASLAVWSCDSKPAQPQVTKKTIAVIPKGTTHEFWKSIHGGANKAAKDYNAKIVWKGPLKEDDREDQIKVVEDFITQGVQGIVLAPLDDQALVKPVEEATKAGIPVVIIDSDLKSETYVSFAATDNRRGGQTAGEEMVRLLGGKGKVVMLRYAPGSASTTNREEGFLDAIKKAPGIEMLSNNQYAGATTETAYQASENLLAPLKKPDGTLAVDGIFTPNESSCFGMLRALQDGKFAGKVKFVGFDSSSKLVEALGSGEINALVVQDPVNMGYKGVELMAKKLHGEDVDKRVDTGSTLVTKENMNDPKVKALLNPPLDELLKE